MGDFTAEQLEICTRFGSPAVACEPNMKVGIALATLGRVPLHALRHPVAKDTTGWYIWAGEFSAADDFFQPLHASHVADMVPQLVPYMALAPGWRVLLAPGHEDVWHDPQLLKL